MHMLIIIIFSSFEICYHFTIVALCIMPVFFGYCYQRVVKNLKFKEKQFCVTAAFSLSNARHFFFKHCAFKVRKKKQITFDILTPKIRLNNFLASPSISRSLDCRLPRLMVGPWSKTLYSWDWQMLIIVVG